MEEPRPASASPAPELEETRALEITGTTEVPLQEPPAAPQDLAPP